MPRKKIDYDGMIEKFRTEFMKELELRDSIIDNQQKQIVRLRKELDATTKVLRRVCNETSRKV